MGRIALAWDIDNPRLPGRATEGYSPLSSNGIHNDDEIDLAQFAAPLSARWKLLLLAAVVAGAAGFVYSRTLPRVYQSSASIFVQSSSGAASLLKSIPIPMMSAGTSTGYLQTLLQSEALATTTINKLKLGRNPRFAIDGPLDRVKALEAFDKAVTINETKNGAVTITVRTYDPRLAADIANTMLDGLGKMVVTSGRRKADFIEQRLAETTRDLASAEEEMSGFLTRHKVAGIEDQTRQLITELGELESKLLDLDAELESVRSQLTNAGNLDSLVDQEVRKRALESSRGLIAAREKEVRAQLEALPAIGVRYARIQRRIAVLTQTFQTLTEQYQLARITQKGEDGDYQIIDRAEPNPERVAPSGGAMAVAGAAVGVFAASLLVLLSNRMKRNRSASPPPARATAGR